MFAVFTGRVSGWQGRSLIHSAKLPSRTLAMLEKNHQTQKAVIIFARLLMHQLHKAGYFVCYLKLKSVYYLTYLNNTRFFLATLTGVSCGTTLSNLEQFRQSMSYLVCPCPRLVQAYKIQQVLCPASKQSSCSHSIRLKQFSLANTLAVNKFGSLSLNIW